MSYDSTTGVVSAPVSLEDIAEATGWGRAQGAPYNLEYLCRQINGSPIGSINMWAKYRPFLANRKRTGSNDKFFLGLTNGSMSGEPNPNAEGFTDAVTVKYYPQNDTIKTNYRYDEFSALGVNDNFSKSILTPVYYKNGTINSVKWDMGNPPNSKFYRMSDFEGYCNKAHPIETFYCTEALTGKAFRMKVNKSQGENPQRPYSLSSTWIFNTDWGSYGDLFLGILFTKVGTTDGNSYLINTNICLGSKDAKAGLFSDYGGDSASKFYIPQVSGVEGSNSYVQSTVYRRSDGFFHTARIPETYEPNWWVVNKSNGNIDIEIYLENLPENGFFVQKVQGEYQYYIVQLVAVNGQIGGSNGINSNISFTKTDGTNNGYIAAASDNVEPYFYSLNSIKDAFCIRSVPDSSFNGLIYYQTNDYGGFKTIDMNYNYFEGGSGNPEPYVPDKYYNTFTFTYENISDATEYHMSNYKNTITYTGVKTYDGVSYWCWDLLYNTTPAGGIVGEFSCVKFKVHISNFVNKDLPPYKTFVDRFRAVTSHLSDKYLLYDKNNGTYYGTLKEYLEQSIFFIFGVASEGAGGTILYDDFKDVSYSVSEDNIGEGELIPKDGEYFKLWYRFNTEYNDFEVRLKQGESINVNNYFYLYFDNTALYGSDKPLKFEVS